MSFDAQVVVPDRGRVLRVDVSTDNFATITYRWGDVAGPLDNTNEYDDRILELGPVRRGLGRNRIAAASTTTLKLDNADGAMDFLCGSTGLAEASSLRFRIYVGLYDPTVSSVTSIDSKMLGEFILSAWPSQTQSSVSLSLGDDMMGRLGPGLELPNFIDWSEVGDASDNPIFDQAGAIGIPDNVSEYTPIQLAFGEDWVLAHPHVIPMDNNAGGDAYENKIIVPLYCTTNLDAVVQTSVQQLRVERYHKPYALDSTDGVPELFEVPREVADPGIGGATPEIVTVWTVEKSPTITKAGKDFQIVYLVVRTDLGDFELKYAVQDPQHPELAAQRVEQLSKYAYASGYPVAAVDSTRLGSENYAYAAHGSRVQKWYVKGLPLSQTTNPPSLIGGAHAIDVMTDLVSVYSDATVDAASAARVKAGSPFTRCAGVVQAWSERANNAALYQPPLSLRQVLTQLAQSSDFDVFLNWDGEVAFASDVYDFTTATQPSTLLEIEQPDLRGFRRWVPSNGERHSAYNRVFLEGGRSNPAEGRGFGMGGYGDNGLPFQGPWDLAEATIPVSTRIIEVGLQQGWRPWAQQRLDPIQWRSLDVVSRDRISFGVGRDGLLHELGSYFKLTWTRGASIGGPYSATIFQCEAITYHPADDTVEIEAVWRDDTQTERQYLLDDETLLVRSKGALTGACTENAVPEWFDFGGTINLTTMGVDVGDILVLRDSAEAVDGFAYNCCYRIVDVTSTTRIEVTPGHTETAHAIINADWSIVRGATTYPTAVSDPTNYPSGGAMFGKVTQADGTTSDAEVGNRLISG